MHTGSPDGREPPAELTADSLSRDGWDQQALNDVGANSPTGMDWLNPKAIDFTALLRSARTALALAAVVGALMAGWMWIIAFGVLELHHPRVRKPTVLRAPH